MQTNKQPRDNTQGLGTEPIGRLLLRLALPAMTAQLVNVLYNIVDRMYIGNIPDIGKTAITGLGVAMPIIVFITAFSSLIGMGGAPLASIRLGAKDEARAQRIMGNCVTLLTVAGVLLMAVIFVFKRPLLYAFGASGDTIQYADQYLTVYNMGTLFVMFTMGLNNFINCQGFASVGMKTVLIGAVLNIILDPIFIFGFHMGVTGAALATILSQLVSCIWVLRFLTGKHTHLHIQRKDLPIEWKLAGQVLLLGLSPFIMQATESLVQIVLNVGLQKYGGDVAVGAMTIIMSVMQIFMMPLMGLGQGSQPIISYNYGAGNMRRVKQTFWLLLRVSLLFALAFWGLIQLFPQAFVMIFNRDPELMQITVHGMRVFLAGIFAMGAQYAVQQTFLSVGQAKVSIFIAMLRKVILLIPLAIVLPLFMGTNGIFLAEPIADLTSATTACVLFFLMSRKLFAERPAQEEA